MVCRYTQLFGTRLCPAQILSYKAHFKNDVMSLIYSLLTDEVAEWLRRWTANPRCSARLGSNPILVVSIIYVFRESSV